MAESHVITGLVSKRSELAGLVDHHRKEIARLGDDLKALDAAIKIFDPDYNLSTVKAKAHRVKNSFFEHGEATKLILDVLRDAGGKLDTMEIGNSIANRKGIILDTIDDKAFRACIITAMSRLRSKGTVRELGRDDAGVIGWRLCG